MTEFLIFWLPLIGMFLLGTVAAGEWYTGDKVKGIWFGLFGLYCLLFVVAIQWTQVIQKADRTSNLVTNRPLIAGIERWQNFATADQNGQVTEWTFRGFIKNTGNSEALNGHNHINLTIRDTDLPDDFDYHDVKSSRRAARSIIAAQQENELLSFVIPIAVAQTIYRGDRKMFFYGWFEYDGSEGTQRHRTEFAYKIGFPNDPSNTSFHKPMSFDLYGIRYNCVDKDCLYQPGHPPPQENEAVAPGFRTQ